MKIPILAKELGVTPSRIYEIIKSPEFLPHVKIDGRNKTLTSTGVAMIRESCQGVVKELTTVVNSLTSENESLKLRLAELQEKYAQALEQGLEQARLDKERYAELLAVIAQNNQHTAIEDKASEGKQRGFWGRLFGRG
jgi:DNA-binding transcriptional MerR regulator